MLEMFPICVYCGTAPSTTVDHRIPLSKGGSNDYTNLVGACSACNSKKKDKLAGGQKS